MDIHIYVYIPCATRLLPDRMICVGVYFQNYANSRIGLCQCCRRNSNQANATMGNCSGIAGDIQQRAASNGHDVAATI